MDIQTIQKSAVEQIFFPHDTIRKEQEILMQDIQRCLHEKKTLIAHAPTGLGKTAAALGPSLKYALDNNKTIFFLTSRHTQHIIALDTLKKIHEKYTLEFTVGDIIGKKWMCALPAVEQLYSNEFSEFCKKMKEDNKCENYANTRKNMNLTVEAKNVLHQISSSIHDTE